MYFSKFKFDLWSLNFAKNKINDQNSIAKYIWLLPGVKIALPVSLIMSSVLYMDDFVVLVILEKLELKISRKVTISDGYW